MPKQTQKHLPVLKEEVLHYLQPQNGDSLLDVTAGYGGHAQEILRISQNPDQTVLVDRDGAAVKFLRELGVSSEIIHQDFLGASRKLESEGRQFDMILADLGLSTQHLENQERGFSIKNVGPLDMRMDQQQPVSASDIVNHAPKNELIRIFRNYGEEPKSQQIAAEIIKSRPLVNTNQLAAIAVKAWPGNSRVHPATRIFMAIRIAVNDELNQLERSLPIWLNMLKPGGRLAIISFHSLEDRIVKNFFADNSARDYGGELEILTKKPVTASKEEIDLNPRARSAKLRAAVKIKTKRKD